MRLGNSNISPLAAVFASSKITPVVRKQLAANLLNIKTMVFTQEAGLAKFKKKHLELQPLFDPTDDSWETLQLIAFKEDPLNLKWLLF